MAGWIGGRAPGKKRGCSGPHPTWLMGDHSAGRWRGERPVRVYVSAWPGECRSGFEAGVAGLCLFLPVRGLREVE
jgi:hypothetical protein